MPFKLVAVVETSMSLGSILMTAGVHVMSIDTLSNTQMKQESAKEVQILLPKTDKPKNPNRQQKKFHHPLGRTASDFIVEYLQQHKSGTWRQLQDYVAQQGFARSSVNNGIQRLVTLEKIKRTLPGIYIAIQKKTSE